LNLNQKGDHRVALFLLRRFSIRVCATYPVRRATEIAAHAVVRLPCKPRIRRNLVEHDLEALETEIAKPRIC